MGLVKLGFHNGGVPLRLVEDAGVSTCRKPIVSCMCPTLSPATGVFLTFRCCTSTPELPWDSHGSSKAGIPL